MAFTQSDIEDVAVFAASRGLTVLQLGASKEDMAIYNSLCFQKERVVFLDDSGAGTAAVPDEDPKPKRYNGCVELITLDE